MMTTNHTATPDTSDPSLPSTEPLSERATAGLKSTLKHQIAQGRFTFVLQPIVSVRTNKLIMREALLRYRSKDGLVWPAASVVPRAEVVGVIDLIDCLALETAAQYLTRYPAEKLSINLSRRSLNSAAWFTTLGDMLRLHPGFQHRLIIEITETIATESGVSLAAFIRQVTSHGIQIAIDDFGAGVTTWADVEPSDVSYIKFDRALVNDLEKGPLLIQTVQELIADRDIQTVAEGVENRACADRMQQLGVDHLQGYLFGAPRAMS